MPQTDPEISFRRVTAWTVTDVCELSETLSDEQREMVADNAVSIAEAHFSESAWFRAIYADETLAGFIMLHTGADYDDGIERPGVFLWRLMVAGPHQGRGIGRKAVQKVVADLTARGIRELRTSYDEGPASPGPFYKSLGFIPSGDFYGEEIGAVLRW
ncbi:GNAT family N-acetyltransferase [Saccharopolyspora indica]|uniref:GNAT family N-acetyltransferase n=1 Tax=Saccharopolyspora indica TaxID=1229659 RepID=UPI0022EAE983|nr:GNAT family N-acetyltransferase [Saccharopolyspora indica]MDA3645827.1 GNAT family N-acetyltransferase [Saccharopolyspora indica]